MSGPIIRSGASPEFSKNWDKIFGAGGAKKGAGPAGNKAAKKPAKATAVAVKAKAKPAKSAGKKK